MNIDNSHYNIMMTFGKYKDRSLGYILEFDRSYVKWLAAESRIPSIWRDAAVQALRGEPINNPKLPKRPPPNPADKARLFVVNYAKGLVGCTFKKDEELKERFKSVADGVRWNPDEFHWEFSYYHLHPVLNLFKNTTGLIADDGVKQWFMQLLEHRKLLDIIRTKTSSDILVPTLLPLYSYQLIDIEFGIASGGRWINADAMGLGKTPTAIGFALLVGGKALIVCPKSVKIQWEEKIILFAGKESCVWGSKGPEGNIDADFHIINYDNVSKFIPELNSIGFNTLICDEATHLKNHKSIRTKSIFGNWKERKKYPGIKTKYLNLLTGTPILSRPTELFTLLSALDKKRFNNPVNFIKRYGGGGIKPEPQNLLELFERSKDLIIRHTKAQVAKELSKWRGNVLVELEPKERKTYQKAVTDLFKKWKLTGRPSAAHMPALRGLLFEYKFPRAIEFAQEMIDSGRPLLIFTIQQEHAERIHKHFGNNSRLITGKVTNDRIRRQYVQDVIDGKAQIMVMTIIAGGMGIDGLQEVISDTLFVDRWWVPGQHEQAEDRTNRKGQKSPTSQWYLTVPKTYDEDMQIVLDDKQRIIDLAVEGKIPEESDEIEKIRSSSIFGEVLRRMALSHGEKYEEVDDIEVVEG